MSFVKEVTYHDDQRSHWVADVVGRQEWDAVNENWIQDQQIGWRSTSGVENFGKVTFQPINSDQTKLDVYINYNPPAGVLGDIGENLGVGERFEKALQNDLNHFSRMVDEAPAGALDPNSSNYLFHGDSAAAKGTTTSRQNQTMYDDASTNLSIGATTDRPLLDSDITGTTNQDLMVNETELPTIGGQAGPATTVISNRELPEY
ncbi:MAG: hypothetical protein PVSMB2_17120 [Ktedonobacteraceae bacterium]